MKCDRTRDRAGTSDQQSSTTADIINRHISNTPDIINHEGSSSINDINSYLDPPQPIRNSIQGGKLISFAKLNWIIEGQISI